MTGLARIHLVKPVGTEEYQLELPAEWLTIQEWGIRVEWPPEAGSTLFPWHNVLRIDLEPTIGGES